MTEISETHLYLIDDEENMVRILGKILTREGYRVSTFTDPSLAVSRAGEDRPDIIVTDIAMPGEDGAELTRTLRREPALAQVPVIAVTGAFNERSLTDIYQAGADVLLSKPVRLEHLLAEVHRLLTDPHRRPGADGGDT